MPMRTPPTPYGSALRRVGRALLALPSWLAWFLPLGWMGFIWFLSSQRLDTPGGAFGLWGFLGNLAHAPLFGFLALFWIALLLRGKGTGWPRLGGRVAGLVMLLVGGYGVIDEWHQSSTGGRQSSASDVLTDVVGAVCVLWIVHVLGDEGVTEGALRRRLLAGVALCAVAAWLALL